MTERELFDLMWQASYRATVVCQEQGFGLGDKVTKDSAKAAAEEVYRLHTGMAPSSADVPESVPMERATVPPVVVPPVLPPPPIDPRSARMEREFGEVPDDVPF